MYKPQFRQKRKRSRSPAGPRRLGTATRISASLFRRLSASFGSAPDQGPKAAKFAVLTPGHAGFPNRAKRSEGSDTTPTQKCKKYNTGVFITAPNRAPAETQRSGFGGKRTSDRESESCRLRRDEGFVVRSDDGQHRICLVCGEAAALPNAPSGQSPAPKFRAEARTHF